MGTGKMNEWRGSATSFSRLVSDYGMLLALLLLCGYYSMVTWDEQHPTGAAAGEQLAGEITRQFKPGTRVFIAARENSEDVAFADALEDRLSAAGLSVVAAVKGQPVDARRAIQAV